MKLIKRIVIFLILIIGISIGYIYYRANQVPEVILRFNEDGVLFDSNAIDLECKDKYFYKQLNEDEKLYYQAIYYSSINNSDVIEWLFMPDSILLKEAKNAFIEDYPLYYWWNNASIYTDKTTISNKFNKQYTYYISYPEDNYSSSIEANVNKLESIGNTVKTLCYDDDKFKYIKNIHDYILDATTYSSNGINTQTLLGALIDNECVCEGYARAFQYLSNKAGFNCICVTGLSKQPINSNNLDVNHAWNMIQIDNNWYHVDCTWDDAFEEKSYFYLLLNDEEMSIDHYLEPVNNFVYPTSIEKCNEVNAPILITNRFDREEITTFINRYFEKFSNIYSFRFVNIDDFNSAKTWLLDNFGFFELYFKYYGYDYPNDSFQYICDEVSHTISIYL